MVKDRKIEIAKEREREVKLLGPFCFFLSFSFTHILVCCCLGNSLKCVVFRVLILDQMTNNNNNYDDDD